MRQKFVHEMFTAVAAANPALPAIVAADEILSYGELDLWSNNVARHLADAGARKGSIIYIAAESTFSVVASMLASLKLGAVFVPVDPRSPPARLQLLTSQVAPDLVLADRALGAAVGEVLQSPVPVVAVDGGDGGGSLASRLRMQGMLDDTPGPQHGSEPDDMCYVYFTSGSTGKPKAIAGRLKAIDHFVRWEADEFGVGPGTVVSQLASPVFDAFLRDVFTPLCFGGVMRVLDSREMVLDAKRLARWLNDSRIELVHTVPSIFRAILAEAPSGIEFASLRTVALSGEPFLASDARRWQEIFGTRIRLVNLYGPSETTMVKLFHVVQPQDLERHAIPVGKAMPGARALVLDEAGRPTAEGAVGEIFIRTPYATLGYFRRPDLTEQVFVPNPLSTDPNDIVYKTGDLGRMLDDGSIEFLGRRDSQVKVRGVRIETAEIENAILELGLVAETAVTTRTDKLGNSYLCAYVVTHDTGVGDEINRRLAAVLPDYMLPSVFLELERLPRTATGKVDRNALPASDEVLGSDSARVEPRNEIEARAAKVFAEVLGLERVDIHGDFFKLGGHSLLAMTLLSNLISQFEVDLPLASLFEYPTVAQIAPVIAELQAEGRVGAYQPLSVRVPVGEDLESRVAAMSDGEVDALLRDILTEQSSGAQS